MYMYMYTVSFCLNPWHPTSTRLCVVHCELWPRLYSLSSSFFIFFSLLCVLPAFFIFNRNIRNINYSNLIQYHLETWKSPRALAVFLHVGSCGHREDCVWI